MGSGVAHAMCQPPDLLKNNLGQATLLEFWASWCRPCRVENPNLVALHKKMSPKGFKIIGISLDKKKSSWLQAIEDDGLTWDHVSHLKYWEDPIAKEYHVKQLPASLLLDKEGRIVATNLKTSELEIQLNNLIFPIIQPIQYQILDIRQN